MHDDLRPHACDAGSLLKLRFTPRPGRDQLADALAIATAGAPLAPYTSDEVGRWADSFALRVRQRDTLGLLSTSLEFASGSVVARRACIGIALALMSNPLSTTLGWLVGPVGMDVLTTVTWAEAERLWHTLVSTHGGPLEAGAMFALTRHPPPGRPAAAP